MPLNKDGRPGVECTVLFEEIQDMLTADLKKREDALWDIKVEEAKVRGQNLTRGLQYGLAPNSIADCTIDAEQRLIIPLSQITYARIELATILNQRDVPNVLALCEIMRGPNGYLFVERGGKVAYHGGTSQLHALVAGNYPRTLSFVEPQYIETDSWLKAQQTSKHGIKSEEVTNRQLLGIVLDRSLGYKPDIAFTIDLSIDIDALQQRYASDKWEAKGVISIP